MAKLLSKYEEVIKKSRFIGLIYEVDNIKEVGEILESLKKEHKKCRHIPYAYKVNNLVKKSDDKEPSGTAGTPLYNLINRNDLDNTLVVVVRYFGGIKLGAGPLLRAYTHCINEAFNKIEKEPK